MEKKKVLLTRLWDGHSAGEVVEEDAPCAESMVRKGYGVPYCEPPKKVRKPDQFARKGKNPAAETADATASAETADVTPQFNGKQGD